MRKDQSFLLFQIVAPLSRVLLIDQIQHNIIIM